MESATVSVNSATYALIFTGIIAAILITAFGVFWWMGERKLRAENATLKAELETLKKRDEQRRQMSKIKAAFKKELEKMGVSRENFRVTLTNHGRHLNVVDCRENPPREVVAVELDTFAPLGIHPLSVWYSDGTFQGLNSIAEVDVMLVIANGCNALRSYALMNK